MMEALRFIFLWFVEHFLMFAAYECELWMFNVGCWSFFGFDNNSMQMRISFGVFSVTLYSIRINKKIIQKTNNGQIEPTLEPSKLFVAANSVRVWGMSNEQWALNNWATSYKEIFSSFIFMIVHINMSQHLKTAKSLQSSNRTKAFFSSSCFEIQHRDAFDFQCLFDTLSFFCVRACVFALHPPNV